MEPIFTVADLVSARLRAGGVQRVFGAELPGLQRHSVENAALAALLADADGRLGPAPGVALVEQLLRISSRPGSHVSPTVVDATAPLIHRVDDAVALAAGLIPATVEVRSEIAWDAPIEMATARTPQAFVPRESPAVTAERPVMLAGPGVLRAGAVDDLQAVANATGIGVANTWGAKGVFQWDDPHHLGTCGLQRDDFALLGFADADVIIATGIDPDESSPDTAALVDMIEISPHDLPALAAMMRTRWAPNNELYPRLAAVVQRGAGSPALPMHPARAVADLGAALPSDGLIAAEPGWVGLWVARTFPTVEPASVVVPATVAPGIAAALAYAGALRGRPSIAVVPAPVDEMTEMVVEHSRRERVGWTLMVWGDGGDQAHVRDFQGAITAAIGRAVANATVAQVNIAVDEGATQELIDVAGPVVAWGRSARG